MKKSGKPFLVLLLLLLFAVDLSAKAPAGSPVGKYGQLQVISNQICNTAGKPVQLKGMSTMGLQWYGGIINSGAFKALAKDWKADVIRLALYIGENGYAKDPSLKTLLMKGVDLAIAQGLYVIIDWHVLTPGNPNDPVYAGAEDFFKEMATKYGKYPNVIYEIMNEPNGPVSWENDLKPYAQKMVNTIRNIDPDNLILIGSGNWSQDVHLASADPVEGKNLAYTVHFYSGSHGEELRYKIKKALAKGIALFCSEWGCTEANGNGGPYINNTEEWLKFLDENKIGWINWSLSSKLETSAAFKALIQEYVEGKGNITLQAETPLVPDRPGNGGIKVWSVDQLTISGAYARAKLRGEETPLYQTMLTQWSFEQGLQNWAIADDSPVKPELFVETIESPALAFKGEWSTFSSPAAWFTAPRLRIGSAYVQIGTADTLSFDLYLEAGKKLAADFTINPVLQYPPAYWTQLPTVEVKYKSGVRVKNGFLKYHVKMPISVSPDTLLINLVLIVVGNGTGYKGKIAFDNIAFSYHQNGDGSVQEAGPPDNPGQYMGLPWNFTDENRQGWVMCDDSPVKIRPIVKMAETEALSFNCKWTLPSPKDLWSRSPRISSSFVDLPASKYKTITTDFYLEAGKTTNGNLVVQPIIQSPQYNFWFQVDPVIIDFSKGKPVANGLLKYSLRMPITKEGQLISSDAIIRNLIFITVGEDTDYAGTIYYDNINLQ